MTDTPAPQELRPHLRNDRPPDDSVVVIRGGPTTLARLTEHVRRTYDAYMLDGLPLWGASVFCALDDIGPASLRGLLERFASYGSVHLPTAGQLRAAGFELLASFGRPHFTVRVENDDPDEIRRLLDALGRAEPNPYHGRRRGGQQSWSASTSRATSWTRTRPATSGPSSARREIQN